MKISTRLILPLICLFSLVIEVTPKIYVNYTGDLILGALFPIHSRGNITSDLSESDTCDKIQAEDGIQPLESLLFTINKINEENRILPGIKLGVLALDSCDSPVYSLNQSLDFIKGFIAHFYSSDFHQAEYTCSDGRPATFKNGQYDKIIGVIGGQSSSVSIQVANLLRLFQVPQISYMATSPQLSNRERFPYFFRTVPSDLNQAYAILGILRYFQWTYITVIYSDSEYGVHCYETLRELAVNDSICFAPSHRVIRDQFRDEDSKSNNSKQIMEAIANDSEITVIILILEKEYVIALMEAVKSLGLKKRYVWVGTDGWSNRDSVVATREEILEGAIAVHPLVGRVSGFDEYFTGLTPKHNEKNPWWKEHWEAHFDCKLDNSSSDCSNKTISPDNGYSQQSFLHFVRDTALAFAYALREMQKDRCGGEKAYGLCKAMEHIDGSDLVKYLANVTFKDEEESTFRFIKGNGPTRYTIINYQQREDGYYFWAKVGNYSENKNGDKVLNLGNDIRYRRDYPNYPNSTCSIPCLSYQIKVRESLACCWKCRSCGDFQIRLNELNCGDCEEGTIPDSNHTNCISITPIYIDYTNPWAIGAMAFATIGILITIFVTIVFWSYSDTPIIKAAGRELSYVLLFGILLSFSITFVIVAEPNAVTCSIMRFFLGFAPTLCYAAILTKTNRIARIFHHKSGTAGKTKFISPKSQMIIVVLLSSIEVFISIFWFIFDPPGERYIFPDRMTKLKICGGLHSYSYMIGFIYPLILIIFCTVYAIQTRKTPLGFKETQYIAFTNYTVVIIWLAFVPLYFASPSNNIRIVTLAISLSLSGMVELFCLFFPKIYIVLLKPEKNTKEIVMQPNRSSFVTLSNSASMPIHQMQQQYSHPSNPHFQINSNSNSSVHNNSPPSKHQGISGSTSGNNYSRNTTVSTGGSKLRYPEGILKSNGSYALHPSSSPTAEKCF